MTETKTLDDRVAELQLQAREAAQNKLILARHLSNRVDLLKARDAKVTEWKAQDNATANLRMSEMQSFSNGIRDIDKVITDLGGAPPTTDDPAPTIPNAPGPEARPADLGGAPPTTDHPATVVPNAPRPEAPAT
jgi:hypothetical protein